MRVKAKIGDLIYIPAEVVLFKNNYVRDGEVKEWKKVERPTNLLITDVQKDMYEVYYESEYWLVNERQVYKNQE